MSKFTLESAQKAQQEQKLHQWVIEYLNSEGNNTKLAKILNEEQCIWIDLVEYPLDRLSRVMGPEENMVFREKQETWKKRIEYFVNRLNDGEVFSPIIATDIWDSIHIADGTHRFEALKKTGHTKYWTIFFIKDAKNKL